MLSTLNYPFVYSYCFEEYKLSLFLTLGKEISEVLTKFQKVHCLLLVGSMLQATKNKNNNNNNNEFNCAVTMCMSMVHVILSN